MERSPHILIFPSTEKGHMIPLLDLTHSLACHGLSLTVLTTPQHQSLLDPLFHKASTEGLPTQSLVIPLPPTEGHLPECENFGQLASPHISVQMDSFEELSQPIEEWFQQQRECIISDFFLGLTRNIAGKLGIHRVVFHPSGAFSVSVNYSLWKYMPHEELSSDSDTVHIPEFPHPVSFAKCQMSRRACMYKRSDPLSELACLVCRSSASPCCFRVEAENKYERGKPRSINESVCQQWLDCRGEKSVIYICFGTRVCLTNKQIEIAAGLEASEEYSIWVIRDPPSSMPAHEYGVLPLCFEEKTKGRGLIIRGWAPQLFILSHPSLGGFLIHCRWNYTLESITLGVPLITWPMTGDQYYNARLLVEYLKVGVRFCEGATTVPNRDDLKFAVKRVLAREGEEVKKLEELSRAATMAVQEGGSSDRKMEAFVSEMKKLIPQPK
eukprot:PITA_20530